MWGLLLPSLGLYMQDIYITESVRPGYLHCGRIILAGRCLNLKLLTSRSQHQSCVLPMLVLAHRCVWGVLAWGQPFTWIDPGGLW